MSCILYHPQLSQTVKAKSKVLDEYPASNDDPTSHYDYIPLSKSLENIPKIKEQHIQDLPLPNTLLEELHGSTGPLTTLGKNDEAQGSLVDSQPINIP